MKDLLLLSVRKFLEGKVGPGTSLLLGYSGGPDSKALLYLLDQCRRFFGFDLHLAHVDHGWREESKREADEIRQEAEGLGLPLHVQTLALKDFSPGNWEEQGRELRLEFFSKVYGEVGCRALLLGHHADDQAEVVLKRVFEGASLFSMGGLAPESVLSGMDLWRPLLPFQKKQILEWLAQNHLSYFLDPTNRDFRFLRGKMREELLPLLAKSFGKEIASNLCRLGEESRELKVYFSELNRPILEKVRRSEEGVTLDLTPFLPIPALQLKYLLKEWAGREGAAFSRQIFDQIALALEMRAAGKRFLSGAGEVQVDRGVLCFLRNKTDLIIIKN